LRGEGADVPHRPFAEKLEALEVPAGVPPVERREEPLVSVQQLLATVAEENRLIAKLPHLQVEEIVLQIPAVDVDARDRQVFVEDRRVDHFHVDAETLREPRVDVVPPAPQVVGRAPGSAGTQPVVFIHVSVAQLASKGYPTVIA